MPVYVDSSSTWDEVKAAFEDNASYDVVGDADMCRMFIVAARIYLSRMQTVAKNGTAQAEMDPAQIKSQLEKAEQWLTANDATATQTAYRGGMRGVGVAQWR